MAETAPSLSEITSVKGDADLAQGSPLGGNDAVLPFNKGIDYLTQAARDKASNDMAKYKQFQENQNEYFKNFNTLSVDGLLPTDYPDVSKKYAKLVGDIAANIDVIRNPSKNIPLYQELQQREAELRSTVAQSKMDKAYVTQLQDFTKANPDMLNADNKAKIDNFYTQPIGERKYPTLSLPFAYDPASIAKLANATAQQSLETMRARGLYFDKESSTKYLKDQYDNAWQSLHSTQDKSGRTIIDHARDAYNKLPEEFKAGHDFDSWLKTTGENLRMQDDSKKDITENAAAVNVYDQAQENARQKKQLAFARWSKLQEKPTDYDAGKIYNFALTSAFSTGYVPQAYLQNVFGNNEKVTLKAGTKSLDPTNPLNTTENTKETQVPKVMVTRSEKTPDGKFIYHYVDNSVDPTKELTSEPLSLDKARVAFENILGSDKSGKVAKEEQDYRRKHNLPFNYDLNALEKHFEFGEEKNNGKAVAKDLKHTGL